MRPNNRGVSTYLQTFILLSVALGGSFAAFRAVAYYPTVISGPSLSISNAEIEQGAGVAIERVTVSNTGPGPLTSVYVLNPGASPALGFCYYAWNPATQASIATNCPAGGSNPSLVQLPFGIGSGGSAVIELTLFSGSAFAAGKTYTVIVGGTPASQTFLRITALAG
ncbi:MAG: hypothetical protein HY247_01440 [archaeon]|nr:MAG: hypothetical protein HY247_01440 [archaeon]